jgi:hypothetical protein
MIAPSSAIVSLLLVQSKSSMPDIVRSLREDKTSPSSAFPNRNYKTKLVVHFDINETILVGDDAGGDTRDDCLNKILAKSAFVRIPDGCDYEQTEPTHWWDGTPLDNDGATAPPALYTGWDWPPSCVPYYRTAFKKLSSTFTLGHGKVYRSLFDQMQAKVAFSHDDEDLPEILSHMIPSVFLTLKTLMERPQPTHIVFRTFGTDLHLIAKAVTCFAKGLHPDYLDFVCPDLLLNESNLFRGRWNEHGIYQLCSDDGTTVVASGGPAIMEFLATKPCCGIQDDYDFWAANRWEPWAGKPVWVPRDTSVHHVLLDDNIHNLENDGIASVHAQGEDGQFQTLYGKDILANQGLHLIRVPTIEPILNEHWFVEQLDAAQHRFEAKHNGGLN